MRRSKRSCDLPRHLDRRGRVQWSTLDLIAQCLAFDKLADDVMRAISFADLVNCQDVGMIQRGGCLCFALETSHAIRILCEGCGQHFERDLTFEPEVLGQENFAHSTTAKLADD